MMRDQTIAIPELQSGFQKNSLQGVVVMARFTQDEWEWGGSPSFLLLLLHICYHSHRFSCFIQHQSVSLNFWKSEIQNWLCWTIGSRCIVKGKTRLTHPGGMRRHSMSLPLLPVFAYSYYLHLYSISFQTFLPSIHLPFICLRLLQHPYYKGCCGFMLVVSG